MEICQKFLLSIVSLLSLLENFINLFRALEFYICHKPGKSHFLDKWQSSWKTRRESEDLLKTKTLELSTFLFPWVTVSWLQMPRTLWENMVCISSSFVFGLRYHISLFQTCFQVVGIWQRPFFLFFLFISNF